MTLREKIQQHGQFGEGDTPAIKKVLILAEDVARHRMDLDECNCGEPGECEGNCCFADAARLRGMIIHLVDKENK